MTAATGEPSTTTDAVPARRSAASAAASAPATAAATAWTPLPNRFPSARKFAFTVTSTRSPASGSSVTTFSSADTSARSSSGSSCQPCAETIARPSGCRVFTFDSARACRPRSTSRRTSAICAASSASTSDPSTRGHRARCTESGSDSCPANSAPHTRSVTNGVNGAMSRVRTYSDSCRVPRAAGSPSQKRRRDERTYQLDRSSMHCDSRRPARSESKSSSAAVTSTAVACTCDRAQRSSRVRAPAGSPGVHPFTDAYSVWKAAVFQ